MLLKSSVLSGQQESSDNKAPLNKYYICINYIIIAYWIWKVIYANWEHKMHCLKQAEQRQE